MPKQARFQARPALILVAVCTLVAACATKYQALPDSAVERSIDQHIGTRPIPMPESSADIGFVLSLSGGGTRAANLGLGVLLALDSLALDPSQQIDSPTLFDALDGVSTVSGGGLGVALLNSLIAGACSTGADIDVYKALARDQRQGDRKLDLLRASWANAGLQSANPVAWRADVTSANLFEQNYFRLLTIDACDPQRKPLSLWDAQRNGRFIHVPNATLSGNGRPLAFTDRELKLLGVDGYIDTSNLAWVTLDANAPSIVAQLPYSFAIAASASFPPVLHDARLRATQTSSTAPLYVHLTDGGQSDDNGLVSAIRMIDGLLQKELNVTTATRKADIDALKILYLAVDALPDAGHIYAADAQPSSRLGVLMRNMDLPRYGNKRELAETVYNDNVQHRKSAFDHANGHVFVSHIGLWSLHDPAGVDGETLVHPAKIGTIKAGLLGFSQARQETILATGMMLTYRALLGLRESDDADKRLGMVVNHAVACLLSKRETAECDGERPWHHLMDEVGNIRVATMSGDTPQACPHCFVEFARSSKLSAWADLSKDSILGIDRLSESVVDARRIGAESARQIIERERSFVSSAMQSERIKSLGELSTLEKTLRDAVRSYAEAGETINTNNANALEKVSAEARILVDFEKSINKARVSEFDIGCHCDEIGSCVVDDPGLVMLRGGHNQNACKLLQDFAPDDEPGLFARIASAPWSRLTFGQSIAVFVGNLLDFRKESDRIASNFDAVAKDFCTNSTWLIDAYRTPEPLLLDLESKAHFDLLVASAGGLETWNYCNLKAQRLPELDTGEGSVAVNLKTFLSELNRYKSIEEGLRSCETLADQHLQEAYRSTLNRSDSLIQTTEAQVSGLRAGLEACPSALGGVLDETSESDALGECLAKFAITAQLNLAVGRQASSEPAHSLERAGPICAGNKLTPAWTLQVAAAFDGANDPIKALADRVASAPSPDRIEQTELSRLRTCLSSRRTMALDGVLTLPKSGERDPCDIEIARLLTSSANDAAVSNE